MEIRFNRRWLFSCWHNWGAAVYISYQKGYDRGYDKGYDESEPVYLVKDFDNDGDEELCIGI